VPQIQKVTEALEGQSQTKRDWINHVNGPVRTAHAVT